MSEMRGEMQVRYGRYISQYVEGDAGEIWGAMCGEIRGEMGGEIRDEMGGEIRDEM